MTSHNSFSIYRSVDEDEAALHIEDAPEARKTPTSRSSRIWDLPTWQKIAIAAIVAACVAFILGYLATRRPCAACVTNGPDNEMVSEDYLQQEPKTMDWADLKDLFNQFLKNGQQIESTIRKFSRIPHPSGSLENQNLADDILQQFRNFPVDHTWVESHYATLQFPNRARPNTVKIIGADNETLEVFPFQEQDPYCPYSAVATAKAGLVYVNYGRKEDFVALRSWKVKVTDNLVIVRTGIITFAEKVYNAERAGALGVLIFPDMDRSAVYGHVHLGTGDPNTPGFPSFNHTQFPPFKSSGLPKIPAQAIDKRTALSLLSALDGIEGPSDWRSPNSPSHALGPDLKTRGNLVQLEVNNVERSVELVNVFGSITGRFEPEHYIVVGAQRDSWGPGAAKSGVGTAILLELMRSMTLMVEGGFQPRRSILFVSWDGGDFGSIGATEWLEGYLSMLHLKAATYMSLDTPLLGDEKFVARSSPLFRTLIENIIKQVDNPRQSMQSIYENAKQNGDWNSEVFAPLAVDTGGFAFTAFAGVPALEFSFVKRSNPYKYLDTKYDTYDNLNSLVDNRLPAVALTLAQVAGLSLMKLSHDRILPLDYTAYNTLLLEHLIGLKTYQSKLEPQGLTFSWLYSARGDYVRATDRLKKAIKHSDLQNEKMIQFFNVRIMRVEFYFLSQYVSAINYPYRHILIGRGEHTLDALMEQLGRDQIDTSELHKQIALFTWTLVLCTFDTNRK
ncbi:PREDICTED: transferrin receptor protein 2 [Nanorana parkeri]|uniref:transferrin receptor protein 2 n=1 Tax=Nanorana parkeri TaxID=125878 RepID=UPI0008541086|nr:PREDICTED: transferrin receptor protein 2 [Nanorana parkeri]